MEEAELREGDILLVRTIYVRDAESRVRRALRKSNELSERLLGNLSGWFYGGNYSCIRVTDGKNFSDRIGIETSMQMVVRNISPFYNQEEAIRIISDPTHQRVTYTAGLGGELTYLLESGASVKENIRFAELLSELRKEPVSVLNYKTSKPLLTFFSPQPF